MATTNCLQTGFRCDFPVISSPLNYSTEIGTVTAFANVSPSSDFWDTNLGWPIHTWAIDTSAIPDVHAITAATLYIYQYGYGDWPSDPTPTPYIQVRTCGVTNLTQQASFQNLRDETLLGQVQKTMGAYASGYYAITLNSTAFTYINKTGTTYFQVGFQYPYTTNIGSSAGHRLYLGTKDDATHYPYLQVTSSVPTFSKTITAKADVRTLDKIKTVTAKAQIKINKTKTVTAKASIIKDRYSRWIMVTTDPTKIYHDQTGYVVKFDITHNDLRTVANGGYIQGTAAQDLIFCSGTNQASKLPFEIEVYSATTGRVRGWVRFPNVHDTTPDSIYLLFGNEARKSTSQQDLPGTFTGLRNVWHLSNNTDALGNNNLTFTGVDVATQKIYNGGTWVRAEGDSAATAATTFGNGLSQLTLMGWIKTTTLVENNYLMVKCDAGVGNIVFGLRVGTSGTTTAQVQGWMSNNGSTQYLANSDTNAISNGVWTHLAFVYNGTQPLRLYKDGLEMTYTTQNNGASSLYSANQPIYMGFIPGWSANASLDELRIYPTALTANQIRTEYENQNGTIYTLSESYPLTFRNASSKARVKLEKTKTVTAKARIRFTGKTKSITAKTDIRKPDTTKTITAKARVFRGVQVTTTAKARIKNMSGKTVTAKARIKLPSLTKTITSRARIRSTGRIKNVTSRANIIKDYSLGYAYHVDITIDHTKVFDTDHLNFPVPVKGHFEYLRTVANNGYVRNANGYDIIFTSSDNHTLYAHEVVSWSATTGDAIFFVKIPTLQLLSDTTFRVWYGNPNISTPTQNKSSVWANYRAVYHLQEASGNALDSTATANTMTATGPIQYQQPGVMTGKSILFNGSSTAFYRNTIFTSTPTEVTMSCWVKYNSWNALNSTIHHGNWVNVGILAQNGSPPFVGGQIMSGGSWKVVQYNNSQTGVWYKFTITAKQNDWVRLYKDGLTTGTPLATTNFTNPGPNYYASIGAYKESVPSQLYYTPGYIQEARYATTVLTAGWIKTEYYAETDPAFMTFFGQHVAIEKTVTARARIKLLKTKTVTSKTRVELSKTKSVTSKARIEVGGAKQIAARARIKFVDLTKTAISKARVLFVKPNTVTARAYIKKIITKTVIGKARVQSTGVTKTVRALARIKLLAHSSNLSAKADIRALGVVKTAESRARVKLPTNKTISGLTRVLKHQEKSATAQARVKYASVTKLIEAKSRVLYSGVVRNLSAQARILKNKQTQLDARGRVLLHHEHDLSTLARVLKEIQKTTIARAFIKTQPEATISAKANIQYLRTWEVNAQARIKFEDITKTVTAKARVYQYDVNVIRMSPGIVAMYEA